MMSPARLDLTSLIGWVLEQGLEHALREETQAAKDRIRKALDLPAAVPLPAELVDLVESAVLSAVVQRHYLTQYAHQRATALDALRTVQGHAPDDLNRQRWKRVIREFERVTVLHIPA
jgi:hypothetical protein